MTIPSMICLNCAMQHPNYRPLKRPILLISAPCCACRVVKPCVSNDRVGLPDAFLTVEDAFRLIAAELCKLT